MTIEYNRRSLRLPGYDYTQPGYYFVTICVQKRVCWLGEIADNEINFSNMGKLAHEGWTWLADTFIHLSIDTFCIMPNHTHAIMQIHDANNDNRRGRLQTPPTPTSQSTPSQQPSLSINRKPLGRFVGAYKTHTNALINKLPNTNFPRFWQRNFYEHIIRNQQSLNQIRQYIIDNLRNWAEDIDHPHQWA